MRELIRKAMTRLSFVVATMVLCVPLHAEVNVGLYFVEGDPEPIDFLTFPGYPPFDYINPWQITAEGNQFVLDGGLASVSEQQVREAVGRKVVEKFYSIPTPTGYMLDIDFTQGRASGSGTVNVLIGEHNQTTQTWLGFTALGGGLGEINGESNAAISVDRIDSRLSVDFTTYDQAINAIANVVAHETAHLFWLEHVWADDRADLGWSGEPVVTDPYDVMATGPSGLPDSGWLEDNIFTTVSNTQVGGHSSVSMLIDRLGLRLRGDFDRDNDVDVSDVISVVGGFTGSGATGNWYNDGDTDTDGDVDVSDVISVVGNFTGAAARLTSDTAGVPNLIYDPATGNVALDGDGLTLTAFQLESLGLFNPANHISPGDADLEEATPSVLSYFVFSGGFTTANIGDVFPAGLDLAGLENMLSTADYAAGLGSDGVFDLLVIPEPSSLTLVGLGGWILFRRSRRGG